MRIKIRYINIISIPTDLQLIDAARRLWNWNFNSVDEKKITKTEIMDLFQIKLNKLILRLRITRNYYYELIYSSSQKIKDPKNKKILAGLLGWKHLNHLN